MSLSEYSNPPAMSNWGYPLYECNCCPYGFHIDLDFVRYCESISKEADRTGSIQRRKDRRRQRKSMEVLLGLESITQQNYARPPEPISPIPEIENRLQKQDSFDNVIDDFEKTLQRSKSKLSHNLPDVTAVSDIRRTGQMSSETVPPMPRHMTVTKYPQREYDNANEYCNLSPTTFKNIREQMALSLERTRQLEEQMKQLPELKVQISKLKDENQRLLLKLKQQEDMKLNLTTTSYSQTSYNRRNRSNSSSDADSYHENEGRKPFMPISTKEMGVGYSVLTRNVGVGHQTPSRKNVSTETTPDGIFADKWFGEKLKFISDNFEGGETDNYPLRKISTITKGCQTQNSNNSNQSSQTVEILEPKKIFINKQTQISHPATNQKSVGVLVKPSTNEVGIQKFVEVYNIGVSDDTITDIHCEKCNVAKISIGVGADKSSDTHTAPVSLASLSFPRSKSFNLGEDKINLNVRNRSIGLQYHYKAESSSKSSQYESLSTSRSCQSTVKTLSRAVQYELKVVDSSTQSEVSSFRTSTRDVSCEAVMKITETKSVGCNTTWVLPTNTVCSKCEDRERRRQEEAINATNSEGPSKKEDIKRDDSRKKDELSVGNTSRIPRLTLTPTPERRKFRRQDTYTKINTSPPPEESHVRLSGLDLSSKPSGTGPSSTFDKVKENFKFPVASKSIHTQNETNRQPINAPTTEFSSNPSSIPYVSTTTTKHRKKATPSKEMQGAMKVLNDSLLKRIALPKSHKAIDIIQQEWFKISGLISANPLDVEDYLDAFEDMSSLLLDYIVNMTDGSGNTSMHYAVSHGNFDVVSILLDSKVCDINKPNTAGYTSVMLVSLSDIRSSTHANVVRRLFQMADVNIRAKQHGQTALMLAVSHGRIEMVKMLLEAGADINIQDDDGSTALMCAAEHGHIEIVKHFLSQPDCDSTITDVDGSTALKIAMEAEHRPIGVLLYAHERNLIGAHGHKHKKKPLSPKPPSSPLSIRQSHSALNETKNSK